MELFHANNGAISMTVKDVATGESLMSYGTRSIDLFRGEANQGVINRPKWGIYRARNNAVSLLKDEIVRFANFCSSESSIDFCPSLLPDTGQPAAVSQPTPVNGARHVQTYMPISWLAANGADGYNIYFGDTPTPPLVETVSTPGYAPIMEENTTYYYQIGAVNSSGETLSPIIRFTTLFDADDGSWEVARGHARPDRESPQFFAFNTNLSGVGEIDTTALIPGDDGNVAHTFLSTENTTGNHNWRYRPEEDEEVTVVVRLKALPDNGNISYIDYRNAGFRMKCRTRYAPISC